MKKCYSSPDVEFVLLGNEDVVTSSPSCKDDECDFDCPSNCSCHFCVGVCTWDCTADDSTCTTGDFNP